MTLEGIIMEENEILVKVAELSRWKNCILYNKASGKKPEGIPEGDIKSQLIPRYTEEHDKIIEVIKKLKGEDKVNFVNCLRIIHERDDDLKTVHWFAIICSTPMQLCEAFLMTHGIYIK